MFDGRKKGFTLIELMVVVAIIGILAMIAFAKYSGFKYRAARSEAYNNLDAVRICEESYMAEHGRYMLCAWNPDNWTPVSQGTTWWDSPSGFDSIGYRPVGKRRYKYGVDGYKEPQDQAVWIGGDGEKKISNGEQSRKPVAGKQDICIMALGDLDGNGRYGKLFVTDEPPGEVQDANPGEF